MLPYYEIPPLSLGALKIHPFGVLVATAVLTGSWLANKRARELRLDDAVSEQAAGWAVIPGFIMAHLYSAIGYFPERMVNNPVELPFGISFAVESEGVRRFLYLLKVWDGISSFGGFLGGTLGVVYFLTRKAKANPWGYADAIIYGFVVAWIFGRLGCTVAFDHPGSVTDFFLAMPYPGDQELAAGVRHNLGMYEAFWAMAVSAFFYSQRKKAHFAGWYVVTTGILYAPFRFSLDFLRAVDKRYTGLTPGQYGAIVLFAVAIWVFVRRSKSEPITPIEDPGPGHQAPAPTQKRTAKKR